MSRYNLTCPLCGKTGNGEWHQPAFDEKYYQCSCGKWWHPELIEIEPEKCKYCGKKIEQEGDK